MRDERCAAPVELHTVGHPHPRGRLGPDLAHDPRPPPELPAVALHPRADFKARRRRRRRDWRGADAALVVLAHGRRVLNAVGRHVPVHVDGIRAVEAGTPVVLGVPEGGDLGRNPAPASDAVRADHFDATRRARL